MRRERRRNCDGFCQSTAFIEYVCHLQERQGVPVAVIRDTGQSVIPSQESGQKTEKATRLDDRWVWHAFGVAVEIADAEQEESEIEGEEEEEKGDRRTEGEEKEDGGEDEPTLG